MKYVTYGNLGFK